MASPASHHRWYRLTPDRLLIGLLAIACLLWLSERFRWFQFNEHKGYTVLIAVASVGVLLLLVLLWLAAALLFHWRFQFSICSLLLLTVAVAVPFTWLAVEMKKARAQREAVEAIAKVGGYVQDNFLLTDYLIRRPVWLRRLLGDDFFGTPILLSFSQNSQVTDEQLACLDDLFGVRLVYLTGTRVTDAGLIHLREACNFSITP
jgi:MFS family permease